MPSGGGGHRALQKPGGAARWVVVLAQAFGIHEITAAAVSVLPRGRG